MDTTTITEKRSQAALRSLCGVGAPLCEKAGGCRAPGEVGGACPLKGALCPSPALTPSAACWAETCHHRLFSFASRARSVPPVGALGGQPGSRRDRDALSTCRSCSAWGRQPPLPSALPEATSLSLLVAPAPTGQRSLPWGQRAGPSPGGRRKGALPTFSASSWVPFWLFRLLSTCLHSLH